MHADTDHARWVEPFFVHSFDVNHLGLSTPVTLLKMMQEAAWKHAEVLGVGYEQMKASGLFWVLSRVQVEVIRYPAWGEEFMLETWPSGIHRLLFSRDFRITDDHGVAAEATSSWIILDLNSRRPVRPQNAFEKLPTMAAGELVFQDLAGKVELPEEDLAWNESKPFMVRVSALDSQGHVNNAKYFEWCLDAFSMDHFSSWEIREATLNFLAETHYDSEVHVRTAEIEPTAQSKRAESNLVTMQEVTGADGTPSFACKLRWTPRVGRPGPDVCPDAATTK